VIDRDVAIYDGVIDRDVAIYDGAMDRGVAIYDGAMDRDVPSISGGGKVPHGLRANRSLGSHFVRAWDRRFAPPLSGL
jgi:hypothetical protein